MAVGRYIFTHKILNNTKYATSRVASSIFKAVNAGKIPIQTYTLKGNERLDVVAGMIYGNSNLWWIIAAASGIGWALQVPPGTLLRVPTDPGLVIPYMRS